MATKQPQSERDYQAIVESVPAIVFIADTGENGIWHYVNEWIEPILGFTVEEWTTDPGIWARQLHPEDREAALAAEEEGVTELTADRARRPAALGHVLPGLPDAAQGRSRGLDPRQLDAGAQPDGTPFGTAC